MALIVGTLRILNMQTHRPRLVRSDRNTAHVFFASCPRGLETILTSELEHLGANDLVAAQGGLGFTGNFRLCYRVNLESRIASRVLWRVYHGSYRHEENIYQAAYGLPWPEWFSPRETIKIKVSAQHCPLKSLDFVTLRIKDAVCDKFRFLTKVRPSVDTHQPGIRIDAFLQHNEVTLYLDTSGEPLFKRGLRRSSGEAPLRMDPGSAAPGPDVREWDDPHGSRTDRPKNLAGFGKAVCF